MSRTEFWVARVKELDATFQRLTGREAWGHLSSPTPTQQQWVFGDGTVVHSGEAARDYMSTLLYLASVSPEKLPYPFDQPLSSEQDLRVINGWPVPDSEADREERIEGAMGAFREWRENPPKEGWE